MKQLFSMILVIAMVFSLGTSVFANEEGIISFTDEDPSEIELAYENGPNYDAEQDYETDVSFITEPDEQPENNPYEAEAETTQEIKELTVTGSEAETEQENYIYSETEECWTQENENVSEEKSEIAEEPVIITLKDAVDRYRNGTGQPYYLIKGTEEIKEDVTIPQNFEVALAENSILLIEQDIVLTVQGKLTVQEQRNVLIRNYGIILVKGSGCFEIAEGILEGNNPVYLTEQEATNQNPSAKSLVEQSEDEPEENINTIEAEPAAVKEENTAFESGNGLKPETDTNAEESVVSGTTEKKSFADDETIEEAANRTEVNAEIIESSGTQNEERTEAGEEQAEAAGNEVSNEKAEDKEITPGGFFKWLFPGKASATNEDEPRLEQDAEDRGKDEIVEKTEETESSEEEASVSNEIDEEITAGEKITNDTAEEAEIVELSETHTAKEIETSEEQAEADGNEVSNEETGDKDKENTSGGFFKWLFAGKPSEQEAETVKVIFDCIPENIEIHVYERTDEDSDFIPHVQEEDGSYLLKPGKYWYDALDGELLLIQMEEFTVDELEDSDSPRIISVDASEFYHSASFQMTDLAEREYSDLLLSINWGEIEKVGHQSYSGPCACYALAYCRTMLDGQAHNWEEFRRSPTSDEVDWLKGAFDADYYPEDKNEAFEWIIRRLNSGKPAVARVNGTPQHYVAVVGYTNVPKTGQLSASNFLIIDPAGADFLVENMAAKYDLDFQDNCYQAMCTNRNEAVPVESSFGSYFDECTMYPTYGVIEITESCSPCTLPCNSATASKYGVTSTVLTDKSQSPGNRLNATGIVLNSEGHYWYRVNFSGTTAYIWANCANWKNYTKPWIDGNSFPTRFFGSQSLSGTIMTGGAELKSVQGFVLNGNTTDLNNKSNVYNRSPISTSGTYYSLKGSAVDSELAFGNLLSGNTYTLVFQVNVECYSLINSNYISGKETKEYTLLYRTFQYGDTQTSSFHYLNVDGMLDGAPQTNLGEYGLVHIYINGTKVTDSVNDYCMALPSGTTYSIIPFTNTGYRYQGTESIIAGTIVDSDIDVILPYSRIKKVTFDANGGRLAPEPVEVNEDGYFTIPDIIPVRQDYFPVGWAKNPDAVNKEYKSGDYVYTDSDLTLYAVWRYIADSGSCGDNLQWTFDSSNGTLTISGTGAMNDFDSDNTPWVTQTENITSVYIEDGVTSIGKNAFANCSNMTEVRISPSVGSIGMSAFNYCSSLSTIRIPDGVSVLERALFYGCNSLAVVVLPETVTAIRPLVFAKDTALSDIYFYGTETQWNQIEISQTEYILNATVHYISTYTISFDANGGYGAPSPVIKQNGVTLDMMNFPIPSRAGYEFWGWSESSVAEQSELLYFEYTKNQDAVLYAVWKKLDDTIVTYDANGGEGAPVPQTVLHDDSFEISNIIPTRAGYDFLGWSKELDAETASYIGGQTVRNATHNITFYAVWKKQLVSLSFDANGGTNAPSPVIVGIGEQGTIPATIPVREGYSFIGWYWEPDSSEGSVQPNDYFRISYDVTLYAIWKTKLEGWQKLNDLWYYYDENGEIETGWANVNNKWYFFNESGAMQTGWQQINGKWYYLNGNGSMVTGWVQVSGKWYYMASSGVMQTGWQQVGGKWYYFSSSGAMQTGWVQSGGKWYYFEANGAMVTGWKQLGGKWYYFEANGAMVTGWKQLSGKWYYFEANGAMVTGWKQLGGKWYYFEANGAMITGWKQLGGKWYYFESSGRMLASTSRTIGGKSYKFDANGVCVNP